MPAVMQADRLEPGIGPGFPGPCCEPAGIERPAALAREDEALSAPPLLQLVRR